MQSAGLDLKIAVNLSTRDLMDRDLPSKIDASCSNTAPPAAAWCSRSPARHRRLTPADPPDHESCDVGLKLSIDDFGWAVHSLAPQAPAG